jgi:hypothetical protein
MVAKLGARVQQIKSLSRAAGRSKMKALVRLIWIVPLLMAMCGCDRLSRSRLVSEEYGFSLESPEKLSEQSDTNFQRLPKSLWTVPFSCCRMQVKTLALCNSYTKRRKHFLIGHPLTSR